MARSLDANWGPRRDRISSLLVVAVLSEQVVQRFRNQGMHRALRVSCHPFDGFTILRWQVRGDSAGALSGGLLGVAALPAARQARVLPDGLCWSLEFSCPNVPADATSLCR